MGYSDPGPSPRTARQIAAELGDLIHRSDMKLPVVLVGWSYGGLFVRTYASQHESQVAALVLVDASHEDQADRFAAAGFPPNVVPWTERWASVAARFGLLRLRGRPSLARLELFPEPVRRFVQATEYRPSSYETEYEEDSHESTSFAEVRALRRPLSIPVVVLSAGKGPVREIWMPLQRDLLRLSNRSCQMVAVDTGHGIPYHAPATVVRAVRTAIAAWSTSSPPTCS
jgi:pimeloyl-ACP methyl ester carboxylesterase